MAEHHIVEHRDAGIPQRHIVEHRDTVVEHRETDSGAGAVLGIVFVLLLVVVALFFALGGPSRFVSAPGTPNQTNINVPSQSQPQTQPQNPAINVPRQIDINVNQPAQQAPANQQPAPQAPANQQPGQQAPAPAGNR